MVWDYSDIGGGDCVHIVALFDQVSHVLMRYLLNNPGKRPARTEESSEQNGGRTRVKEPS